MKTNEFNKSIINFITIPFVILSLFAYYQVEFYLFLIITTIIILINFDNYWYLHWIFLVFTGPILSSIFLNTTFSNMSKNLVNNILFLIVGLFIYYIIVSIVKSIVKYIHRKKVISTYRHNLEKKVISTLNKFNVNEMDFSLNLSPLSYESKTNDKTKVKLIEDLSEKLISELKTVKFKDVLFGRDNQVFLSSIKKFLEIKDLLNNYRIDNPSSVMSIFKNIKDFCEKNNASLDSLEKVFKAMDYESMSKLQEKFVSDYNSCVLKPPPDRFVKGLVDHTDFKYIENIGLKDTNKDIILEDIIISNTGVFLIQDYYEPINLHHLKVDINGLWIKFYNSGEMELDKEIYKTITTKTKLLEDFINSKLIGCVNQHKPITVIPVILLDHKDVSIENHSMLKIIQSSKLEEMIKQYDDQLADNLVDSISTIVSSLIPPLPTYDYELPSQNMLNLVHLGSSTMKLVNELHQILFEETTNFLEKYKP